MSENHVIVTHGYGETVVPNVRGMGFSSEHDLMLFDELGSVRDIFARGEWTSLRVVGYRVSWLGGCCETRRLPYS